MTVLNPSVKHIHCIGIGGIGVSGIAELLSQKGYQVSGSDVNDSSIISRLKLLGLRIEKGHRAEYVATVDLVVYSSAIADDNLELQAAKTAGIPLISRGKLLAELMHEHFGIAVAGTHGKTTTTGFLANTFVAADYDPTYVIGGRIRDQETTVRFGKSQYFIAEADESDQSFLYMSPHIAVITNIEADHLENYAGGFEQLKQSFLQFIETMPKDGFAVLGIDCPIVRSLLPKISRRAVTFGFADDADYRVLNSQIVGLNSQFTVQRMNTPKLILRLNLPGKHNIQNALPAVVIANELGIPDEMLTKGLQEFPGMGRRFHSHGEIAVKGGKALLFEDYGHHPSAIAATISMAKQAWPGQRIILVFQPHRYSRTRDLMSDFVRVLSQADMLVLLDVYAASEQPDDTGSTKALMQALEQAHVIPLFIPQLDQVSEQLPNLLQPNDIVILQGAGSVGSLASRIREA